MVFDSSTCLRLPLGGDRSPGIAWIESCRWDALTPEQRRKCPPICPNVVLELRSPSDPLRSVQTKMQEYPSSGARLGWLLNPEDQQVEVYRPGQSACPTSCSNWPGCGLDLKSSCPFLTSAIGSTYSNPRGWLGRGAGGKPLRGGTAPHPRCPNSLLNCSSGSLASANPAVGY
jgi:hypothetical protein